MLKSITSIFSTAARLPLWPLKHTAASSGVSQFSHTFAKAESQEYMRKKEKKRYKLAVHEAAAASSASLKPAEYGPDAEETSPAPSH